MQFIIILLAFTCAEQLPSILAFESVVVAERIYAFLVVFYQLQTHLPVFNVPIHPSPLPSLGLHILSERSMHLKE